MLCASRADPIGLTITSLVRERRTGLPHAAAYSMLRGELVEAPTRPDPGLTEIENPEDRLAQA